MDTKMDIKMDFRCKICNKDYSSYKSLWNHNNKFHNNNKQEVINSKHNGKQEVIIHNINTCKYCNNVIVARCDRIICNKCLSDGTHTKYVWKKS